MPTVNVLFMLSCTTSLLSSGDQTIAWIAAHLRHPMLNYIMEAITNLGGVGPILLIMSAGYWCWNKSHAKTIIYGILLSALANLWLKGLVMECRPPKHFHVQDLVDLSYSFPSGHAQVTTVMWFGLAYYVRSKILRSVFILTGLLISVSRNYLGVHYVHDVLAGILVGLIILSLCIINERKQILQQLPNKIQFVLLIAFIMLCIFTIHHDVRHLIISTSLLFGVWLGSFLEEQKIQFVPSHTPMQIIRSLFIGISGIFLFWKGGDLFIQYMLPLHFSTISHALQYILVGTWITFGTPSLLKWTFR